MVNSQFTTRESVFFKKEGYATGIFGKWHLGDAYPYRPEDRGFTHVVTHAAGGVGQTPDFWGNDYLNDTYYVNGEFKKFDGFYVISRLRIFCIYATLTFRVS